MKILIVDDSQINLKLLRAQLEGEGHGVLEASDGILALEVIAKENIDLIISDILMPRMDGYQLCSEIRKSPKWRSLPIIIYTASYTSPSDEKLSIDLGADRYLRKPAPLNELTSAIEEVTKNGKRREKPARSADDSVVMREYNQALVSKLEQKLTELEQTNAHLTVETDERKAAQFQLKLSEMRFSSLVESAMDAIVSVDEQQNIIMFNRAAEEMFGYKIADVLGEPLNRLIPSRFHASHSNYVSVFGATGVSSRHMGSLREVAGIRADGTEFAVEASISHYSVDGIKYFSVILRDASERKKAEELLRQSEERFNKAFQLSPVGMVLAKLSDNQIVDVNQAWCEITGYSREETLAAPTADLVKIPPETIANFIAEIEQHGSVRNMEVAVRAKAGHQLVLLVSIELIKIGDLDCSLTTFVDITARNRALEKLRDSERRNRTLYEIAEQRLRQSTALRNIDTAISNSLDLNFTLDLVLTQVRKELGLDAADILLYNSVTHILDFFVGQGFNTTAPEGAHIPLGQSYAGKVVLDRKPVHLSDLSKIKNEFLEYFKFPLEGFEEFHCLPLIAKGKVLGVLETFHRSNMHPSKEWLDYLATFAAQAAIAIENNSLLTELQRANNDLILGYDATIEGWSRALDLRDHETEGHTQRVTNMTVALARALNLSDQELVNITRGALLHDIGKMGVPDNILLKPGKLTDEEWVIMRQHPVLAYHLLSPIEYLKDSLDIPYCHHEKWDGTGYPRGLKEKEIPFSARIFAVSDVYDALTSHRPYREPWTKQRTLEYIAEQAGTHFDPDVVRVFLVQQGFS